jgi:hypothetical protein
MNLSKHLTCVLVLVLPVSLVAGDSAAAILYSSGTAWINGASVPKSSAVFDGDLVQTRADSVANIKTAGSDIVVLSDSLVQMESNAIRLEHGSVTVRTSKSMAAQVRGLTIKPAAAAWTVFQVTDTDSTIHILARTGDLTLSDGTTLPQGEETTREEQRKKKRGAGAPAAAGPGILNTPIAVGLGAAGIAGLTTWVLLQGDDPVSPSKP